jgi:uncharacterized membrane protein (DUF485 family)
VLLLVLLAAFAVQLLETRINGQGVVTGWAWRLPVMVQQTLIDAAVYMVGIWSGIAWKMKKTMNRHSSPEGEELPPEA